MVSKYLTILCALVFAHACKAPSQEETERQSIEVISYEEGERQNQVVLSPSELISSLVSVFSSADDVPSSTTKIFVTSKFDWDTYHDIMLNKPSIRSHVYRRYGNFTFFCVYKAVMVEDKENIAISKLNDNYLRLGTLEIYHSLFANDRRSEVRQNLVPLINSIYSEVFLPSDSVNVETSFINKSELDEFYNRLKAQETQNLFTANSTKTISTNELDGFFAGKLSDSMAWPVADSQYRRKEGLTWRGSVQAKTQEECPDIKISL